MNRNPDDAQPVNPEHGDVPDYVSDDDLFPPDQDAATTPGETSHDDVAAGEAAGLHEGAPLHQDAHAREDTESSWLHDEHAGTEHGHDDDPHALAAHHDADGRYASHGDGYAEDGYAAHSDSPHPEDEDEWDEAAVARADEERARRRRFRQIRGLVIIGVAMLVMVILAVQLIGGLISQRTPNDFASTQGDEVVFTVNAGEGAITIGQRLEQEGIIATRGPFVEAVQANAGREIQPGEYRLREQMTAADAASGLQGDARVAVSYVVVNRGERIDEVIDSIVGATPYSREEIVALTDDPQRFGLPEEAENLEGYLAPGEYRIPTTATAEEIIQELTAPTFATLEEKGITDAQDQYRTVIIASIVEAEALPQDYATVAGIIENRLAPGNTETNGYLQIDATVIYGLAERRLQFTEEERRDASNAYNTYVHPGLTPGPIGAPSEAALEASANHEDNDYFYWVTVNIATGETKFASTLAEHLVYQNEYRAWCAENRDIC
ncbi:MAG: endolytic transglycosylase MltG [Micrococcus sp.]|nr:endolytic transglycosylase MltG [Micrococcus sp.]